MFKKFLVPVLILSITLLLVVGCDKDNGTEPEPVNEFNLVAAAGDIYFTSYTTPSGAGVNTTITAVFDNLTDGDDTNNPYIIDYRSAADYAAGHIKDAVNMPLADLVTKIDDGIIPTNKTILNVCYSGQTASAATCVLNMLGYEAQNLKWGMCSVNTSLPGTTKWTDQIAADEHGADLVSTASTTTTENDFPTLSTSKESAEDIIKARFTSDIAPGWPNKPADDVWDNKDNYFIINYWSAAEYASPGHIPGAFNFVPMGSLKSDAQLKLLPTDKPIIVYCYTGQTSAQVATYLQILGYDAYSLLYGTNGFAYNAPDYTASRYAAPAPGIYDSIIVP